MGWVQEYARTLAKVSARRNALMGAGAGLSPFEMAARIKGTRDPKLLKNDWMNFEPVSNNRNLGFAGLLALHPNNPKNLWNALNTGGFTVGNLLEQADEQQDAGKGILDILGGAVRGAGQGLRAGLVNAPEFAEDRILPSDFMRANAGPDSPINQPGAHFVGGLALDIGLDPLSYVGPGAVRGAANAYRSIRGTPKAEKLAKTADDVERSEATQAATTGNAVVPTNRVDDFLKALGASRTRRPITEKPANDLDTFQYQFPGLPDFVNNISTAPKRADFDLPFQITSGVEPPRAIGSAERPAIGMGPNAQRGFTAGAEGLESSVIRGAEVANLAAQRTRIQTIMDELSRVPSRRYPRDLKIDPIYRETVTRVPRTVEEEVVEFAEVFDPPKTLKPDLLSPLESGKVRKEGEKASIIYKAILSRPDHVIKFGKNEFTVAQLREAVRKNPAQERNVRAILRGEADRLATLHASEVRKQLDMPKPTAEPSVPRLEETRRMVKKEITEDVKKFTRFSDAEKLAWRAKYTGILAPEDMTYILRASSVRNFETRVATVLAKPKSVGFAKFSHLYQAIKAGFVDEADVANLMKVIGARKVDDIPKKLAKVYADAEKAERKLAAAVKKSAPKAPPRPRKAAAKKTEATPPASVSPEITSRQTLIADLEARLASGTTKLEDGRQILPVLEAEREALRKLTDDTPELKPVLSFDDVPTGPEIEKAREVDELVNKVQRVHAPDETIWSTPVPKPEPVVVDRDYWAKKPKVQVTDEQAAIMGVAGHVARQKNLVDPAKWPFETKIQRTKRTEAILNEGRGRNLRGWNKWAQSDMWRVLLNESSALPRFSKEAAGGGYPRNASMYDYVMPMLQGLEDTLKRLGANPIIGEGQRGLPLGLHDILSSLPKELVVRHVIDFNQGMYTTRLADAVEIVLEHGLRRGPYAGLSEARAAVKELLGSPIKTRKGTIQDNWHKYLVKSGPENANHLLDEVTDALFAATPELISKLEVNSQLAKIALGEQVQKMSDEVMDAVVKAYTDPRTTPGDRLEIIADIPRRTSEAAKKQGVSGDAETVARAHIDARAAETTEVGQHTEIKTANAMAGAKTTADVNRVSARRAEAISDEIAGAFPELPIESRIELSIWAQIARAFNPHFRVGNIRKAYNEGYTSNQAIARKFSEMAARIGSRHSTDSLRAAFNSYQRGVEPNTIEDALTRAAYDELKPMMDSVFDPNKRFNIFARLGIDGMMLNKWMRHFGLNDKYFVNPELRGGELTDAVRQWEDIDDPLDFMSRFHSAVRQVATLKATGAEFSRLGSTRPGAGLYKITDASKKTQIGPYIDFTRFYTKEQIDQLSNFNKFLQEAQKTVDNKLTQYYDSFLHMYKSGLTIYRIGHHIRNMIGDASLSYLAGVNNPKYMKVAASTMARHRAAYNDINFADQWDYLQQVGTPFNLAKTGKVSDKALTAKLAGGRTVDISYDALWNLAHRNGLLPSYTVLEDISFDTSRIDALPSRIRKPFGGRVQRVAAGISTGRDHFVRLTDFSHHLENSVGKFKNLDDAAREAARLTRKWHPDGSDLSHFEKTKLRRLVTFYSWIRKAIPLTVEAMYTRPGRVMVFPKAMYNFAEANGIDLQSISNPFPQDQLFPSWMTEDITGPVAQDDNGSYYGINPGIAHIDVLNDFFSTPENAARTALGSAVPFVKVPFELATGNDVRTGAQINDWSEYADRQIPFVTMANSITNVSPTGTAASLFPGGEPAGPDIHRSVERGYESPGLDAAALVNSLLGAGVMNMSKPNYIKQAQFELRDRLRNG